MSTDNWYFDECSDDSGFGWVKVFGTDIELAHTGDQSQTEAERRRVGLLMSAAPVLLDALKLALRDSGCDGDLCMHAWHEQARRAISAAEQL